MGDSDSSNSYTALIVGLLGVLFVYLKLTHQIEWDWVWVTLPFWIGPAAVFGIMGLLAVAGVLCLLSAWLYKMLFEGNR